METLALFLALQGEPWWQKCETAAIRFGYDTGALALSADMALNCRIPIPRSRPPKLDDEVLIIEWCASNPEAPCSELINAAGR
jgi:hypothetical protein